jgi:5-methylthioadenosine/S-adenosylhomocysteine deaminase
MHIHIHLSETRKEVDDCLAQYGVRPVFHLDRLGLLDTRINLAHGVHLDAAECELLAQKDCGVSVCTESNLKLASGFAPLKLYRETGVRFALGTDGAASNNNLDLFGEMDITAKLHKALNQDPTFLPAVEMVKAVTCDAAKVVGMGERVGSLEPGKFADFILLDTQSLDAQPLYNVYSHIVYTLGTHHVTDVFVNGSQVVSNRRLVNADESELLHRAAQYRQRIAAEF